MQLYKGIKQFQTENRREEGGGEGLWECETKIENWGRKSPPSTSLWLPTRIYNI